MHSKVKSQKSKVKIDEVGVLKNQLARALADYDNLVKRTQTEKKDLEKVVAVRFILRLLSVLDILEKGQEHLKDQGLAIAINEFKRVLAEEGLEEIRPKEGEEFDPEVHEAVEVIGSDGDKKGRVAQVVLPGWRFRQGPVVRIAKIRVFGQKSDKEEELEKEIARGDYM